MKNTKHKCFWDLPEDKKKAEVRNMLKHVKNIPSGCDCVCHLSPVGFVENDNCINCYYRHYQFNIMTNKKPVQQTKQGDWEKEFLHDFGEGYPEWNKDEGLANSYWSTQKVKDIKYFIKQKLAQARNAALDEAVGAVGEDDYDCNSNCDKRRHEGFLCYHEIIVEERQKIRANIEKLRKGESIDGEKECEECRKKDASVTNRLCGYTQEINKRDEWETICDDCEHEHLMDI